MKEVILIIAGVAIGTFVSWHEAAVNAQSDQPAHVTLEGQARTCQGVLPTPEPCPIYPASPEGGIIVPKVTHKDIITQQHNDIVTRTCPDGYEGHFVDIPEGFQGGGFAGVIGGIGIYDRSEEPAYTICFSKEFMDKVRKNQDLVTYRPIIRPS